LHRSGSRFDSRHDVAGAPPWQLAFVPGEVALGARGTSVHDRVRWIRPSARGHLAHVTRDTFKLILALAAIVIGVGSMLSNRPVERAPGVLAPDDPWQQELGEAGTQQHGEYSLTPRAEFAIEARVLAVERYRWDGGADLAPVDLALGWGPMSDSAMLRRLEVTQGARFYTLYPQDDGVDLTLALRHSANMHLIPASATVRRTLESARAGQVVSLRGQLVDAARSDGFTWRTSLSREDTGAGACELLYVESAALR
jgi:hypothetical protein